MSWELITSLRASPDLFVCFSGLQLILTDINTHSNNYVRPIMKNTFLKLTTVSVQISFSSQYVLLPDQGCNLPSVLGEKKTVPSSRWRVGGLGAGCSGRHFIDEERSNEPTRHWFAPLFLQTFPGVFWADRQGSDLFSDQNCCLVSTMELCLRGKVGWDVNIWLSTGILTKHTACFSSNYIYPTNAWFALHADEISLV